MTDNTTHTGIDISVVIPTHNRGTLLRRALASVFAQTLDRSRYEVIVVDDHSTEDLTPFVRDFPIVYVKNLVPLGGSGSRNVGIERARGRYVAFLDDDDEWLPPKLERQLRLMDDERIGFTSTGFTYIDEAGRRLKKYRGVKNSGDPLNSLLKTNAIGTASSVMIQRSAIDRCGLFDPSFEALQDYEMWTKLLVNGVRYHCINETLVNYYIHGNNRISHKAFDVYRGSIRYYFNNSTPIRRYGLRRYWLAYLVRIKADLFRPTSGEKRYARSILRSYMFHPSNIRRLLLYCYCSLRARLFLF